MQPRYKFFFTASDIYLVQKLQLLRRDIAIKEMQIEEIEDSGPPIFEMRTIRNIPNATHEGEINFSTGAVNSTGVANSIGGIHSTDDTNPSLENHSSEKMEQASKASNTILENIVQNLGESSNPNVNK
jgi:hypothetical protein